MARILFFLLLGLAIYLAWRSFQRRNAEPPVRKDGTAGPQAMVSCAKCGLHVPRHEALPLGDRYYCCEEHRRQSPGA